jgi:hypothetical protein
MTRAHGGGVLKMTVPVQNEQPTGGAAVCGEEVAVPGCPSAGPAYAARSTGAGTTRESACLPARAAPAWAAIMRPRVVIGISQALRPRERHLSPRFLSRVSRHWALRTRSPLCGVIQDERYRLFSHPSTLIA